MPWNKNDQFNDIFNSYIAYIKKHFKSNNVIVVFDGYENNLDNINGVEQTRHANKNLCPDIIFDVEMCSTVQQNTLLSNKQNKICFIKYLIEYLRNANITVIQAENDADLLIVKTASQITNKIPVMVADDSDILVLLSALILSLIHI